MKISNEEKIKYGLKLKEYREELGLTQEEVVDRAKEFVERVYNDNCSSEKGTCFNQVQLSNWEKGKYIPHNINRYLLSVIYGISPNELDPFYPSNIEEELESYIANLVEEDKSYISQDNMVFESKDEMKETIGELYDDEDKQAFKNGTHIESYYLTKLHLRKEWSISKKIQYIIDLHIAKGLDIPKQLIEMLNENDEEKQCKMYYKYYINFYNGSVFMSKKKKGN